MTLPQTTAGPTSGNAAPPLAGIRVLDFTHVFAGPFCTRSLADLGAEVLHVETASRQSRAAPAAGASTGDGGQDGHEEFHRPGYAHRSKQSMALNLKTPAGRRTATELASVADVLVENFSSGAMGRLGLDYARLQPLNPRLIYVSMSGYGHSGPRRDWTSMNMNLQAYSGLMMTTGAEGDPPTAISNSWNDFIGGLHGTFEILQALAERADTGVGKNVDLAQFESSVGTLGPLLLSSIVNRATPPRMGNRSTHDAPQGCYRCLGNDEWCTLVVQTDAQWSALAQAIGEPAWGADLRFRSAAGRLQHHDEIDAHIGDWTAELPHTEVETRLQAAGIPAERMRRGDAIVGAPDAGRVFSPLASLGGHPSVIARLPFSFSESAMQEPTPPARLGQHNEEALRTWLGYSPEQIQALTAEGALT